MVSSITVNNKSNTRILEITADYPEPFLAKEIVDEFAHVASSQIAKIMDAEEPTIVEEGYIEPYPSSPDKKKNVLIGGVIGLLLAAGIVTARYLLNDTIKDSEDIEKYLGLNTLALIPVESGAMKLSRQDKKKKKKRHTNKNLKDTRVTM